MPSLASDLSTVRQMSGGQGWISLRFAAEASDRAGRGGAAAMR